MVFSINVLTINIQYFNDKVECQKHPRSSSGKLEYKIKSVFKIQIQGPVIFLGPKQRHIRPVKIKIFKNNYHAIKSVELLFYIISDFELFQDQRKV